MLVLTCSTLTLTRMTKATQPLVNSNIAKATYMLRESAPLITRLNREVSTKGQRPPNLVSVWQSYPYPRPLANTAMPRRPTRPSFLLNADAG